MEKVKAFFFPLSFPVMKSSSFFLGIGRTSTLDRFETNAWTTGEPTGTFVLNDRLQETRKDLECRLNQHLAASGEMEIAKEREQGIHRDETTAPVSSAADLELKEQS